jgi:hypothetical protein
MVNGTKGKINIELFWALQVAKALGSGQDD